MEKQTELLAPAGTMEAFEAAVNAGADAVYLAGRQFGARAYADNFSDEELLYVLRTAHLCGVRINLTVNTLTRESELPQLKPFLAPLVEEGLDGVIVQDLGVLSYLHRTFPSLPLHASTQMSVTTPEAVRFLADFGVTRVVPARELSLAEIRDLRRDVPVELETFIHGAMCYCYSGKCLFSSFLGGRSGNRGRCAQPCRLPYEVLLADGRPAPADAGRKEYYPVSMRDLSALTLLPELIDAGIDSFKIEGRMKKPEYAAGVTAVYRKYIDLYNRLRKEGKPGDYKVLQEDLNLLADLYLRSRRSEGYYHKRNGRDLVTVSAPGYRGSADTVLASLREQYVHPVRRVPLKVDAVFAPEEKTRIRLSADTPSGRVEAAVTDEPAEAAVKRPLTEEDLARALGKTGDTVFVPAAIRAVTKGGVFLPMSTVNKMRRDALRVLEEKILRAYNVESAARHRTLEANIREAITGSSTGKGDAGRPVGPVLPGRLIAAVVSDRQADAALEGGADCLIDDSFAFTLVKSGTKGVVPCTKPVFLGFPPALRNTEEVFLKEALRLLLVGTYDGAFVRNTEALAYLRHHGYQGTVITDASVYVWNQEAREVLSRAADAFVYPLELAGRELADTFQKSEKAKFPGILTVYGRAPLMVSAGCVRKTEGLCTKKEEGFYGLKDRKGVVFPVRTICGCCQNIIYNSVPTSLHRYADDPVCRNSKTWLLVFTDESESRTKEVTARFHALADGREGAGSGTDPEGTFSGQYGTTTGHYRKGAL